LHALSGRRGRYLAVNCGALPDGLVDSELFGHRRGAFTGAIGARVGVFEWADRGTLFLDEVAELAPAVQARLLRVVEDGWVSPVGGNDGVQVDTRLITATWAPLLERVELGRFRGDLLHRISTFVIQLPPLRNRKADIAPLAEFWLARYADEFGPRVLSNSALGRLMEYSWPGNVRELGSVLYRAAAQSSNERIDADAIVWANVAGASGGQGAVRPLEPSAALAVLAQHGGNMSRAARAIGVPRSTLRAWIAKAERVTAG
jgi:transcriptional regulator with GAF, ATPase, and Fis domain